MIKHITVALLCSLALLACSREEPAQQAVAGAPPTNDAPALDFDSRMQEIAQVYFRLRPETATYFGVPDEKAGMGISGRLAQYSSKGEIDRRAGLKAILDELAAIDKATLTDRQGISLALVETGVGNAWTPSTLVDYGATLAEYGVWFLPYPVSHLSGPHVEIPAMLEERMAVSTRKDAMAYLSRLNSYALALDDVIEKISYDRELGVVPPDFSVDQVIANLTTSISVPATDAVCSAPVRCGSSARSPTAVPSSPLPSWTTPPSKG